MLIDGDNWPEMHIDVQTALIDHELTHIRPTGQTDDLRRPKIKMREEDFIVWGFLEVVQRHGANALEVRSVRKLIEKHGQLLLGMAGDESEEGISVQHQKLNDALKKAVKTVKIPGATLSVVTDGKRTFGSLSDEDKELISSVWDFVKMAEGDITASVIQRRLRLGYSRASMALDYLEEIDVLSAATEGGKRSLLVTPAFQLSL